MKNYEKLNLRSFKFEAMLICQFCRSIECLDDDENGLHFSFSEKYCCTTAAV